MEGLNNNFVESVIPLRAIKSAVEFQHLHENMGLLSSLTTSGSSIQYLGGDGQYHDFPESFYVDAFLLKYNNNEGNVNAAKGVDGKLYMQAENTFASELDNKVIGSIELERESDKQVNVSIAEVDVNSGVVSENDLKYLTVGTGARLNFENGILSLDLDQSEAPFVNMMEKRVSAVVGDIGVFDAYGSVIDVGVSLSSLVTSSQLATHAENTSLHVTSELQSTWNAKQVALTSGQLAATNSGITAEKVVQYDAYATNKQSVGGNLPNMNLVTDDNGYITTAAPFVPSTKINTVPTAVQNRVATFTSDGNVKDSGIILGEFSSNETVKEYLDNAVSSSIVGSSYQGTFTYFGTQAQVESVSTAVAGDTAIVYLGSITNLEGLLRGDYNGSTWAFADVSPAPSNGAWMETDNLLGNDPVVPGRIIVKMDGVNPPALDVRPNTTMQLDNVTIGLNSAGRVSLVMKMLSSGKSVMNTIISDSIAYEFTNTGGTDTSRTIKEVIDANKEAAEPAFTKNTAFNKNFDTSSQSATSVLVIGNNDTRLTDARSASDVYAWAKAATKPTYTYSEVGALGADKVVQSQSTAVDTVPCSALLRNSSFACVYRALTELSGITTSSTIAQVCEAMVDNSVLIASTSEYTALLPTGETDSNGLLEITRVNLNRVKLFWSYSNASRQPVYVGVYRNAVGFSGWKQLFTTDNISTIMPISSAAASNTKTMSEKLVYDQLDLKSPLSSPTFTGSPTAPTPTISTGIANKAYVDNGISALTILNTLSAVTTTGNPVTIDNTNDGFVDKVKITNDTASAISSPLTGKSIGKNRFNIGELINNDVSQRYNNGLTLTKSAAGRLTNNIPMLVPAGTYLLSYDIIEKTITYNIGRQVRYTDGTYYTFPASGIGTFTKEVELIQFYIQATDANGTGFTLDNIQLEKGSTATTFSPYTETAFSIPLKDTSGTVLDLNPADVIEMIDGKYHLNSTELADESQDALRSIPTKAGQTNLIGDQPFTFDVTEFQLGLESIDAMLTLPDGTRVNVITKDRMVYITSGEYKGKTLDYVLQEMQNDIDEKQNTLTFDDTPTSGSNNPVTSGGIKTAIITAIANVESSVIRQPDKTYVLYHATAGTNNLYLSAATYAHIYDVAGAYLITISGTGSSAAVDWGDGTSDTVDFTGGFKINNQADKDKYIEVHLGTNYAVIGNYAFFNCSSLTSVTIPDSVTSIETSAFNRCRKLTSITIPNSVTSIGSGAFNSCSGLTSITIPNSVTIIGDFSFQGCSGLTSITIPDSVTSIGNAAFEGCSGLTSITIPFVGSTKDGATNTHFGYIFGAAAYSDNPSYVPSSLKTVIITRGAIIGGYAFYDCRKLTAITIPDSVTSIGSAAFYGCLKLTSITIPDSVTIIGDFSFRDCSGLTSITIPDSVTSIGAYALSGCRGLTSITIPNSVTIIGSYAFYNCIGLTAVTIPDSVTSIETSAFSSCYRLTSINFLGSTIPTIGSSAFGECRIADITAQTSELADSAALAITTAGGTLLTNYRKLY